MDSRKAKGDLLKSVIANKAIVTISISRSEWRAVDLSRPDPAFLVLKPWGEIIYQCVKRKATAAEIKKRFFRKTGIALSNGNVEIAIRILVKSNVVSYKG